MKPTILFASLIVLMLIGWNNLQNNARNSCADFKEHEIFIPVAGYENYFRSDCSELNSQAGGDESNGSTHKENPAVVNNLSGKPTANIFMVL
jgi:hypothetical protein